MSYWYLQLALHEQQMLMLGRACAAADLPMLIQNIETAHDALQVLHHKPTQGDVDIEQIHLTAIWVGLADDQIAGLANRAGVRRLVTESACSFMCSHHKDDIDFWFDSFSQLGDQHPVD